MIKLKLIILFLLLGFSLNSFSQDRVITGTVMSNNQPLPGASILESDTSNGTVTDFDGKFQLRLVSSSSKSIIASYLGYIQKEVSLLGNVDAFEIVLEEDLSKLDEVIVVGYGTKKKVNLIGAVSVINEKSVKGKPVTNAYQALQGESPGLQIQQGTSEPGTLPQINIRGISTINGNTPLIVVDGIVSSLNNVNPNNIKSISVLKDAASASIYGSRAANGVVLVTTKNGVEGKPKFVYNGSFGIQEPTNFPKFVEPWVYATLRNEALVNSGLAPAFSPEDILAYKEQGYHGNFYEGLFKDYGKQSSHNLSMSGADNGLNYFLSLGYLNQESLFKGPDYGYKRYNMRINLDKKINDKLKAGGRMSFVRNDIKNHAWFTEWLIEPTMRIPTIYDDVDENGDYTLVSGSNGNSLARLEKGGERNSQNDEFLWNVSLEYEPLNNLFIKGVFGGNIVSNKTHEFRKAIEYAYPGGGDNQNQVADQYGRSLYLNPYLTANYNIEPLENHNLSFMIGGSSESFRTDFFGVTGLDVAGNDFGVIDNTSEILQSGTYGSGNEWAIKSVFYRIGYTYADKYLLEGNVRYDGSSRFGSDYRWGTFPSISLGWVLSKEKFFETISEVVSFAKIRASWGQLGNQDINDLYGYQSLVNTSSSVYSFGGVGVSGAYYSVSNQSRTWETSTMKNLGIDLAFFKNKLNITAEVFDNLTEDILLQLPVPATYGLGQPFQNAGSVRNRGWELSVDYKMSTGKVNHSFSLNASDNVNEIVDLKDKEFINGGDVQTILREGFPINSYYALRSDGFFQSEEEIANSATPIFATSVKPGDIKYVDKNGDGDIDYEGDRFIVGNPFPRYTFGFTYRLDWKGFDFSMLIQGVGKRSQWVRGEITEAFHNSNEGPVFPRHIDRWTPVNTDATYPRLTVGAESVNNAARSDFYIQDAKYVRLKNIQVGYTFPTSIASKVGFDNARIYLSGLNLITLSPMNNGLDPEVFGGGAAASGRVYPVSKVLSVGLDINL
ncbi:TonB-dependent receptor [Flavivirga sp. 57AJ16]|uniref:SusC/RagA family TonB-linked outer membrane protein n=1 Tax=Flavivirga sp. 57AJ16 TaxID=3025307 RepID=UPI002366F7DF|nr:TonB-dependent receptor [Flavivirga sp. 57AJ16]MDD7884502.1 TonB-dependent receptor [Flavivirga sp. 57AJ16]